MKSYGWTRTHSLAGAVTGEQTMNGEYLEQEEEEKA